MALLCHAISASGQLLIDFDDGTNPFSNGTISTDYAHSGANSLFVGVGTLARYTIPAEYLGKDIIIKMMVHDRGLFIDRDVPGRPDSSYGSRWGVGNNPTEGNTYIAATLTERTFGSGAFFSSRGYGTNATVGQGINAGTWFTVYGISDTEALRAPLLGDGGSVQDGFWTPPQPGPGAWLEWTFDIKADGRTRFKVEDLDWVSAAGMTVFEVGPVTEIYLYGGSTNSDGHASLSGLYVDSISIEVFVDEEAPTAPEGLVAYNVTDRSFELLWNPSTDDTEVAGYNVYVEDDEPVVVDTAGATVTGLEAETTYTVRVTALDGAGNESEESASIQVTTLSERLVIDFDDENNPFSDGVVSSDFSFSGGNSLFLDVGDFAQFTIPEEYQGEDIVITMMIFDRGLYLNRDVPGRPDSSYGSRWGVGSDPLQADTFVAASFTERTFGSGAFVSSRGYTLQPATGQEMNASTWFTAFAYSGAEAFREPILGDGGSVVDGFWNPPQPGPGLWTKWVFEVSASGMVRYKVEGLNWVTANSGPNYDMKGVVDGIYFYGGSTSGDGHASLARLYVDDIVISRPVVDEEAPSAPRNPRSTGKTDTAVSLEWDFATDYIGVTGYRVYTNGASPVSVNGLQTTITGLMPETEYSFTITALDAAGNESEPSVAVIVTTDEPDTEAPTAPANLRSSNLTYLSLDLSWDASTDNVGVAGYEVLSDPDVGQIIVSSTTAEITGLAPETQYTFTVVAYDAAGNISEESEPHVVTTTAEPPPYSGPDYYVDPVNGSMLNNGSAELPWSTLEAVFAAGKTFAAGDTIYLRSGVHGSPVITGMNTDYVFIMPEEGESPELIRLRFESGSSYWHVSGVRISPEFGEVFTTGGIVSINGSYNKLTDSEIFSAEDTSSWGLLEWTTRLSDGVSINGQHQLLENCTILNIYHGVNVNGSANFSVVRGNHIQNFGGDGIRILADDSVAEYNYIADSYNIDDNHDDGIQSWSNGEGGVGTGTVYRVTLRGNMIVQTTDPNRQFTGGLQGIGCFDGMYEDWVVENNVVITNHSHGITLFGAVNCKILNNTVVDISPTQARPWIQLANHKDGTPPSGNLLRNNLATILSVNADQTLTRDHNLIVGVGDYANLFVAHPYDLHLKQGSAAIDAGSNEGAPTLDRDENPRPLDGDGNGSAITDLGAYEFDGSNLPPDTEPPSTPTNLVASNITSTSLDISWDASTDNVGVYRYRLYTNGGGGRDINGLTATVSGLTPGETYSFTVLALDAAGNQSEQSEPLVVTMPGAWNGYQVIDGWADTGSFLGLVFVEEAPWLFSDGCETWIFVDEVSLSEEGAWVFAYDLVPAGDGQTDDGFWVGYALDEGWAVTLIGPIYPSSEPWAYILGFESWGYIPADEVSADGSWIYVADLNPEET